MLLSDKTQGRIEEEAVSAFCEGSPGLGHDPEILHHGEGVPLLAEGIDLDLIYHRTDLCMEREVHEAVGREVADANGLHEAVGEHFLEPPPGAVDVAHGLMDEVEVEVVEAEKFERALHRPFGAGFACILNPELARHEKILSRDAAIGQSAPDRGFVPVGRGRVDCAIARSEGVIDRILAGSGVGDLVNPEEERRKFDAVRHFECLVHGKCLPD